MPEKQLTKYETCKTNLPKLFHVVKSITNIKREEMCIKVKVLEKICQLKKARFMLTKIQEIICSNHISIHSDATLF